MSTQLPGEDGVLERRLLARLVKGGRNGLTPDRLFQQDEGATVDGAVLSEALTTLQARGAVTEWNGRWFAIQATNWIVGTVQALERGDALLRTGADGEVGYFIGKRRLKSARDGDLVLASRRQAGGRKRRTDRRLPEAAVIKVLVPRVETVVGVLEKIPRGLRLVPFDPKLRLDIELEGTKDLEAETYVVVEVIDAKGPRAARPRGVVREVLGTLATAGVDVLATLRHYGIPDEFPSEVIGAANALPEDPTAADWQGREDLRDQTLITIDGETARDFDDAISIEDREGGGFILGVHIADVSHYVPEGGVLDLEAYARGTSVYFPDRAVPMLPERISNGLCSLRPDVPRLALSAFLEFSDDGTVLGRRFAETVICSRRRLTYTEVKRLIDEPQDGDRAEYGVVLDTLRRAELLMRRLLAGRVERGSIDFDLPEGSVILDLDGAAVGVRPGERNVAHRIIEEFMIAANEAVAAELEGQETPALYRVHDQPAPARLQELKELLQPLGVALELDAESVHPSVLQGVLEAVAGRSFEPFVASLVLRSMKRARYEPEPLGHYALASRHYTHFTSPIRRYPDLLVHRQLKSQLLDGEPDGRYLELLEARLPTIAERTSTTEARAERAERTVLQWKVVRFLAGREGETFSGRVTGVMPFGLFVQLDELYVDGLLPLASIRDEYFEYKAEAHELVGRSGRTFRLADAISVTLDEVDLNRRRLVLGLAADRTEDGSGRIDG